MPIRPGRMCPEPGCGRRSIVGSHYCQAHKEKAEARRAENMKATHRSYNSDRDNNDAFYGTERWKKLSAYFRRLHPLCAECDAKGLVEPSRMTDHIKPRRTHPELSLEWTNLRALCWACHNRVGERVGNLAAR